MAVSANSEILSLERNFNRSLNLSTKKNPIKESPEFEVETTVFRDLHISAFSKAAIISPEVKSVTLGISTVIDENKKFNNTEENSKESFSPSVLHSSTPKKKICDDAQNLVISSKTRLKKNNLSSVQGRIINLGNNFSYKKLLSEFDAQRRLTVDKVMTERIQNMYDTSKLIRESLEHLKRTKLEEAAARRLLLERKILDEIHEQEILNKPKREAEWEKNNLKEAQRIQERNQKVKEAEEEAKKKSEAFVLKRKQVDEILFLLHKEYNQEYKNLLDTIKLCKDKAALADFTANQTKLLKECAASCEGLLKKCKQWDVNNEDVDKAKNLVENIKNIHDTCYKEIVKIQESLAAKAKEEEKVKKAETESTKSSVESSTSSTVKEVLESDLSSSKIPSIQDTSSDKPEESRGILLPSTSFKRKNLKLETDLKKNSPQINNLYEMGTCRGKAKITRSYMGPVKKSRKTYETESDIFDKSEIHRSRNANPRKQFKRVRFSEPTEIVNKSSTKYNLSRHLIGSEYFLNTENETNAGKEVLRSMKNWERPNSIYKKYLSDCFDSRSLETYLHLKNVLQNTEKVIEPLLKDESLKKFRFHCQKAVNIPVNAISPVSGLHMSDKYLKLHSLLSGKTVDIGEVKVSGSQHPLGITYCKYLLAKKFVRQGDLTVSSKPDAAFSIATVLASLWVDFPDFGELVLAHFQAACPYLAPVFMPQVEKQSDEDYHKSLGYHYSPNGEVEKQDSFLRRMSGIMRLYAAVLISKVRQPGRMNPLGLSEGWRWISAILNLEPRPDICASLLYDFLEVAGNEMFKAYGSQFKKVLAYICQSYFPKLEKVTPIGAGGPMVRLEGFLQKILKEESIPPPQGVLPPNFW